MSTPPRNGSTREWRRKRARILTGDVVCAHRDCGLPIDTTLRWPDPMSPSVDHDVPRARGGTDDLSNLQPMHLICNQKKNDSQEPKHMRRSSSIRRPRPTGT